MKKQLGAPTAPRSSTITRWTCGCIGVLFVLVISIAAVRWSIGNRSPNIVIPARVVSPRNKFIAYIAAGQLEVKGKQVTDALNDTKNQYSLAQQQALVDANSAALQKLRTVLSGEYSDMSPRSFYAHTPHYAHLRNMARVLALEAKVQSEKGDWNGAIASDMDCILLGEKVQHGANLIGELTGIAIQSIGRRRLWGYTGHLDGRQSRSAIARFTACIANHTTFADTMSEERYISMSAMKLLFAGKMSLRDMVQQSEQHPNYPNSFTYIAYSKDTIYKSNQAYINEIIANARKPYALHSSLPVVPADPVNKLLTPVYSQARLKDVNNDTQNGLLLITFALRAYFVDHNRYPAALVELIPNDITSLPDDPFALKGTFQYHLQDGGKYVLYSIGPDGVDDGGKVIDDPSKSISSNSNARYNVYEDSKGDVVAGKHIQ